MVADEAKVCRSPVSGIVVKVLAQVGQTLQVGDSLLVREYEQHRSDQLLLDWPLTAGLPYEQRIRRLARWVDDAERQGRRYALGLPGQAPVPMGLGMAHRHRCLRALALMPDAWLELVTRY